jgi:hypothetical protein
MPRLHELRSQLLSDGRITEIEVDVIRQQIRRDGQLDLDDVKFLVELLGEAREVCPAFDDLFFPALKQVLLADGGIGHDEQFYLLKMLYSDGQIRESEKRFLRELRAEADHVSPEFEQLCQTAFAAHPTHWDVGGR